MAGNHAILSPSSAYRWLVCTPSARFEEQIPDEESAYAAEGTLAHELAALLLMEDEVRGTIGEDPWFDSLTGIEASPLYSKEMREHCEAYAAFVREMAGDAHIYVEKEYNMSEYIPLQYGTCDASFITHGTIHVIDFKYGAGVRVAATANKQMMCYALGAYDYHAKGQELKNASLTIFQPRAGGPSSWDISIDDLLKWVEAEAKPKGRLAIAGMGDFVPGKHCQFCKAHTSCKAYYDCFSAIKSVKDKRVMTDGDLAFVLTYGPLVASWVKKVEEDTVKRLESNKPLEGFKLVAGRGKRSFKNEDDVVDILLGEGFENEIFDSSIKSLTAIEKLVGSKRFKELFADQVVNIPGKPQLAPIDDVRPAIGASAADEYDDENNLL